MRYAIFSDIHNNSTALAHVLHHAAELGAEQYFCLGDVGIDACVEQVRQVAAPTVFGNWEVSHWRMLQPINQRWALNLPPMRRTASFWLTHAATFWPEEVNSLTHFLDNRHRLSMGRHFPYLHVDTNALWETISTLTTHNVSLLFHGHTHCQIVWRFTPDNELQKVVSHSITHQPGETLIVGVGSVGRPDDGPGAAYVIYDDATQQIEMVRLSS